jgi:secreted trypsin-like serine protease
MKHLNLLGKGAAKLFALTLLILASFSFSAVAQQKVVGGVDVDIKNYPWQVALTSSPTGSGFCGGSIIGDSWVLTAAHCVNGDSPSNLYIRVGSSDPFASGGDSYSVNQIIVHPSYSGNSYDFALVEIDGAFAFSTYVDAIDLVSPADIAAGVQDGGVMATITGWGTTSSGGSLSSTLQMVEAPIVENNVACGSSTDSNGNSGDYSCSSLDETMICAGDLIDGGEDACQGDSGGPLAVRNAANTKWLLIGATSWGYGCADVNYPGVWSKVSYVLDWITSNADVTSQICADETACNYTYDATGEAEVNNALCIYEIDECGDCGGDGPTPGYDCDGNCVTGETLNISMSDSYGDGWNGNNLIVNGVASTLSSGSSGSTTLCYDSSAGCVDVSCDGGSWQSEVSWTITDENGNQLLAGGAPFTGAFNGADCGPAVPGCTDDSALNYNANATEDDGSCTYPIDCDGLTSVIIEVGGGSWQTEVSWSIAGFEGIAGSTEACLEDGCHTFNMYDSYGDGWNGNTVTIFAGSDILATGTLESGSEGTLSFGLNFEGECGPVYGCTDSLALNYDVDATSNDGSCIYPVIGCTDSLALNFDAAAVEDDGSCIYPMDCEGLMAVMIEVGGGFYDSEISWELNGLEGVAGTTESCLEDGCYTFNMYDSWGDGWNNATVAITTADGESLLNGTLEAGTEGVLFFSYNEDCGYTNGCTDSLAINFDSEATFDDGSCTYPLAGCTDESALNYNPSATEDDGSCEYPVDCEGLTSVVVEVGGGSWAYEVTWTVGDFAGGEGITEICLEDGCHTFNMADSYGDGWNGNLATLTSNGEVVFTGTLESGSEGSLGFGLNTEEDCGEIVADIYGCTDSLASNYNELATADDGSCEYAIDCEGLTTVVVTMSDSYGDGWNGNVLSINGQSITLETGSEGTATACVDLAADCIAVTCDGGSWASEVSWTISDGEAILLSGGAPYVGGIGECGFVYGCTDSLALNYNTEATIDDGSCTYPLAGCTDESALNYNPSATEDDGSCEYPIDCEGLTAVMIEVGGGSWASEISWTLGSFAGGEGSEDACLEDGCHTFNMADSYGDGWNGNTVTITAANGDVLLTGTLETGSEGSLGFGLNTEEDCGEVVGPILGCTDAAAINFNPEATEDDGSCQYDEGCDFGYIVMMTMNDSYGDGWNGNVYVISNGSGAVVAEGTLNEGSNGTDELCLDADCYTMTVGGGSWASEVSWSISLLSDDIMEVVAEGAAGEDFSFAINSECEGGSDVYGCTDATATNYNPEATEDDGSCEYDSSCSGMAAELAVNTAAFGYEVSWTLVDGSGADVATGSDYENNSENVIELCLEEGTSYTFVAEDSYGDGWNGGTFSISTSGCELVSGGLEEGDYAEFAFTASCEDGGGDDTPWDVTITGSNHTIVVDGEAIIDLDGMPIEIGDALGAFFTDDNGDLQCAGYVTWTGSTNSIAAQGDDSTTDEIDGFVSGSEFVWIVWDASEGVELMATATYSDAMPNQGSFVVNGISALSGLATVPPVSEQLISMPEGWSMFSTYMLATDMDMQNMLSPIVDDVVIAKNNEGLAYLPEWGFNGVGDLQVGQGYQIKLLAANDIIVEGAYMLPEENPITLTAGWNMIGYLRLEGADAAAILEGVNASGNLVIAKDYNGSAYLPEWDFNGIGDMVPGQGYQLKINNDDVLQYLSNDESYRLSSVEVTENNVSHFSKVVATDNNMTVVIEDAAWDVLPTEGSEVAAFDKAGNLIGSAIYSSPVTVVTVWGDDAMTSEKEGSLVSEAVSFKVFTSGNVLDFTVTEWAEGSSTYNVDAINVASSIEINTVVADAISSDRVLVRVINVLGQEVELNDESFKGEILFNVYDDGSVEQFVK